MKPTQLRLLNSAGFVFMIAMNALAVGLPLGGKTTGELSDLYPNLFVPEGFTFAIWSVIYLFLLGMIIYQWAGDAEKSQIKDLGPWFIANALCNGLWIVVWHYEIVWLSIIVMLGILFSLIKMYLKLDITYFGKNGIKWLVHVPISIYLGWISVATIANTTVVLVDNGWRGGFLTEDTWAAVVTIVAVVLGGLMLKRRKDIFYAGVVAWASYGILAKRLADTTAVDSRIEHTSQIAMYIMLIGIALTIVLGVVKKNKSIL